ncbi:unnamed protein product [Ectocarpus sp. CCAP 1310/34]|nr:unnamed protein product [Ectocarpus sp. CCAP 1310/34]
MLGCGIDLPFPFPGIHTTHDSSLQAEAISMLMDLRAKISTQEDFAEIAQEHSDCGSARAGGDLGEFGDGQMMQVGGCWGKGGMHDGTLCATMLLAGRIGYIVRTQRSWVKLFDDSSSGSSTTPAVE